MNTLIAAGYGPWHHHGGPGWWLLFPICFGLLWLLVIGGGGYLLWRRTNAMRPASPSSTAEAVLAERYARGEIDEDEYRERLAVLRS
jgi:putative membrane protein